MPNINPRYKQMLGNQQQMQLMSGQPQFAPQPINAPRPTPDVYTMGMSEDISTRYPADNMSTAAMPTAPITSPDILGANQPMSQAAPPPGWVPPMDINALSLQQLQQQQYQSAMQPQSYPGMGSILPSEQSPYVGPGPGNPMPMPPQQTWPPPPGPPNLTMPSQAHGSPRGVPFGGAPPGQGQSYGRPQAPQVSAGLPTQAAPIQDGFGAGKGGADAPYGGPVYGQDPAYGGKGGFG